MALDDRGELRGRAGIVATQRHGDVAAELARTGRAHQVAALRERRGRDAGEPVEARLRVVDLDLRERSRAPGLAEREVVDLEVALDRVIAAVHRMHARRVIELDGVARRQRAHRAIANALDGVVRLNAQANADEIAVRLRRLEHRADRQIDDVLRRDRRARMVVRQRRAFVAVERVLRLDLFGHAELALDGTVGAEVLEDAAAARNAVADPEPLRVLTRRSEGADVEALDSHTLAVGPANAFDPNSVDLSAQGDREMQA